MTVEQINDDEFNQKVLEGSTEGWAVQQVDHQLLVSTSAIPAW